MNYLLLLSGTLSAFVAILHYACIFWKQGFRFLGAGEPIVSMAEQGHWYPPLVAAVIGSLFAVCAAYGFSGANLIPPLPWLKPSLCIITAIYVLRAVCFPLLIPAFPDNSMAFWWVTSSLCLVIGLVHAAGLYQVWSR